MKTVRTKLIQLQKDNPLLTLDNRGYEILPLEIQEAHKQQITEISELLRESIDGFVSFTNFKPRKNNSFDVRCQHYWDTSFIGVRYFNIESFK